MRATFLVVLALAAGVALVAVVGSVAAPDNQHAAYATWLCPDGTHESVVNWKEGGAESRGLALAYRQNLGHVLIFLDGQPARLQGAHSVGVDEYVIEDGPTESIPFEWSDQLSEGDGFTGKLLGPCSLHFTFGWSGIVDAALADYLGASTEFVGRSYTATETIDLEAMVLIPKP